MTYPACSQQSIGARRRSGKGQRFAPDQWEWTKGFCSSVWIFRIVHRNTRRCSIGMTTPIVYRSQCPREPGSSCTARTGTNIMSNISPKPKS